MQWRPKKTSQTKKSKRRPKHRPSPPPQPESAETRQQPPPAPQLEETLRRRARDNPSEDGEDRQRRAKLSRLTKPAGMSLEDWQIELRRQFG